MLKTANLAKTPSVDRLLQLWAQRYTPDLSVLSTVADPSSAYASLAIAASPEGRALTTARLHQHLIEIKCETAAIETNILYAYIPSIVDFTDTRLIAPTAFAVYKKILEIYQRTALDTNSLPKMPETVLDEKHNSLTSWGMPAMAKLAAELEPLLLQFQKHHIASQDWRTIGFITTLFNFSNRLIPDKLTLPEQVLIKPYLRFIEEQVALPWQRVCAAAARYQIDSPIFQLVEQMLPQSREIAQVVYPRLVKLLPDHRSRRGRLDDPGITHSCLRDLEMFQAYLWLCLLEKSMTPIEQELVELCVMVMTGVKVKWEMTELWNKLLTQELLLRVTPQQKLLLLPYISRMQQAFSKQHMRFRITSEDTQTVSEQKSLSPFQARGSFFFPAAPISIVE